jgi:hypothetical protein
MKKQITIAIFALSINAFSQIPTNGLVGYWPFSGNANDLSGNNLNGVIDSAILTVDRFGNPNSAYQFNGINSQIIIADNDLLDLTTNFSISSWFYINDFSNNWSTILSKHEQEPGEGTYAYGIVTVNVNEHEITFQADPNFIASANSGLNGNVNTSQWYHYIAT